MDNEEIKLLRELHQAVIGIPGTDDKGMMGKLNTLCDEHGKLKITVYTLIALLIGGGIITGSIFGLPALLK